MTDVDVATQGNHRQLSSHMVLVECPITRARRSSSDITYSAASIILQAGNSKADVKGGAHAGAAAAVVRPHANDKTQHILKGRNTERQKALHQGVAGS
jgi:hypothetical protein